MFPSAPPSLSPPDPPLVSVIVPNYDGMPFIEATIESVRRQTYQNWELIFCDDVSRDSSVDFIRRELLSKPDPRIKLLEHDSHLGMAKNWNRGLSYAQGSLLKLLPSDDVLHPMCLSVQVQLLQDHPEAGFAACGKEIINSAGRVLFRRQYLRPGVYDWDSLGRKSLYAVVNIMGEPGGILFRRELLASCGCYDPALRYFIDVDLLLKFLRRKKAVVSGDALYQFRIHGSSASASSRRIAVGEYAQMLDRYGPDFGLLERPFLRRLLMAKAKLIPFLRSLVFRMFAS